MEEKSSNVDSFESQFVCQANIMTYEIVINFYVFGNLDIKNRDFFFQGSDWWLYFLFELFKICFFFE